MRIENAKIPKLDIGKFEPPANMTHVFKTHEIRKSENRCVVSARLVGALVRF